MPQGQPPVQAQAIDRLRNPGLLDLPRDRAQPERIERNRSRRSQKSQVAEAWRQLVITHRQIALDAFLRHQPCHGGFLIAAVIRQLEIHPPAARQNPPPPPLFLPTTTPPTTPLRPPPQPA